MDSCNGSSGDVVCGDGVGGKGESPVENPPIRGILKASSFQSNNTKKR